MSALHDSPVGGHSGVPVTFQKIFKLFYWPAMCTAIREYVQSCTVCNQAKPDRSKYPGVDCSTHPFTAFTVARLFLDNAFRLHGMPVSIDRDRVFTSKFWQLLFSLAGTALRMSYSYHPQTDGQTERVNQCLETYLRCFVHACPNRWSSWLSLAEYWYNSSPHSALGRSPFEVYGCQPRHLGLEGSTCS
jgi:transposase InsO family protein